MRKNGKKCEAPGCQQSALISRDGYDVCNLHYQRLLYHKSFSLPQRDLSRECLCAQCGTAFDRGYAINSQRKRNPQYCSDQCNAIAARNKALAREGERFWKYVGKGDPNQCWEWSGYRSKLGYGRFTRVGKAGTQMAHRLAYELVNGPLPSHLFACHKCDNPPCCNPNHLFAGTAADNLHDAINKGRWKKPKPTRGTDSKKAKLTPEDVAKIFTSKLSTKDLAKLFGVTTTAIYWIRTGKNWSWLTQGIPR